jgi:hypothetical protein
MKGLSLKSLVMQAYPSPEWAVFFEVANATGSNVRRHADAVAFGVWPSRGHAVVGFEFKEYRSDWLREKKNPEKAESVSAHCDRWFVVAPSDEIVRVDELPEPWGLCVANQSRTRLKVVKPASPFPDRDPATLKRGFIAAMLRKVDETTVPKVELERIVEERLATAIDHTSDGRELKRLREDVDRLRGVVETFRLKTGVRLEDWRGSERIAEAVATVLRVDDYRANLERIASEHERVAKEVKKALKEWPIQPAAAAPLETIG